ncbi:MAG TPA: hypothetical protein PLX15_03550 [Candidatus Woesearchaeota archaeon]|nr:hypothetical protein [Candidatus Woesearchaeota archaeon]
MKKIVKLLVLCIVFAFLMGGFALSQIEIVDVNSKEFYDVKVEALSNTILDDETANFRITISSDIETNDLVEVNFGLSNQWFVSTKPLSAELTGVRFEGNKKNSFDVLVKATALLPSGIYGVSLDIKSQQYNFTKRIMLPVYYNVYPQNITTKTLIKIDKVDYKRTIDPREEFVVLLDLRNFFATDEDDITAVVSSDKFRMQTKFSIASKQFKTIAVSSRLDPFLLPHSGVMNIILLKGDELVYSVEELPYSVVLYEDLIEDESVDNYFLKKVTLHTFTNNGNGISKNVIRIPMNFLEGLFTQTSEEYYIIKDNQGRFLAFDKEINPNDTFELTVTQNYRFLFFSLIAIGVGLLLYFALRSPIVVKKKAHVINTQEGGITEVKVVLCIKNRSQRAIRNVSITEFIPKITTLDRNFPLGNLEPSRIVDHENKGTIVRWSLAEVERLEERIVSYKIRSKLSIIGNFRLSPAHIRFFDFNFDRKGESNEVIIKV